MQLPLMLSIRQQFPRPRLHDIPQAVTTELERIALPAHIRPGQTVALTAGSRGIANIPTILKTTADFLKRLGALPFLVPAMGSHGGATAAGQVKLLASYGITEASIGVPIRSSMETVSLGATAEGFPVYLDKHASEADHIAIIGRVKPHTGFHGAIESGLLKMMMIGLGKHAGAQACHQLLLEVPWENVLRPVSRHLLQAAPIAFGLAILENGYDETALIEAVRPGDFEQREEALLVQARQWLGRLPLRQADLLIVDEIGKNISGSGMDTNVVGRKRDLRHRPDVADQPNMRLIYVRGLSAKSHGNATGIGLADFTSNRLIAAMDYAATVINCLTAGHPEGAALPVHFESDREVLEAALPLLGTRSAREARIIHIHNTLELEHVEISEPCLSETPWTEFTVIGESRPWRFDAAGNIVRD